MKTSKGWAADVASDKAKAGRYQDAFDGRRLTNIGVPSTPAPSSPTPFPAAVNQTNYDPQMQSIIDQISQRATGDAGASAAADLAAGKIRESSIGARKEAAAGRTMRGVSGTGVDAFDSRRISDQTQRAIAGSTADIASAAEKEKSGLLSTMGSLAAQKAATAQNAQELALRQWQEQEANRRADQQAQIAQQQAQLQLLSTLSTMSL